MKYDDPRLLDRLAGEYVLGSMSSRVRQRFERLRERLPEADSAVLAWERRLMPLSAPIPGERPPSRVWDAIDARTGGGRSRASSQRSFAWLRPIRGFALGVAATLAVVAVSMQTALFDAVVQQRGTLPQSYVGLLTDEQNNAVLLASSTRHGRLLTVKRLRPMEVPAGRVAVLWALPRDGPPFAIGVLPAGDKVSLTLADTSEKLFFNVPRLAVSFEQAMPGPGATPSSFVLTGHCAKLW